MAIRLFESMQKQKSGLVRENVLKTPVLTHREPTADGFVMSYESHELLVKEPVAPLHAPENTFIGSVASNGGGARTNRSRYPTREEHTMNKRNMDFPVKIRSDYEIYQVENDIDFSSKRFRYSKSKSNLQKPTRNGTFAANREDALAVVNYRAPASTAVPYDAHGCAVEEEEEEEGGISSKKFISKMTSSDQNLIQSYFNASAMASSSWSSDNGCCYPLITCRNYSKESPRQSESRKTQINRMNTTRNPMLTTHQWLNHTMLPNLGKIKTTSFSHHRKLKADLLSKAYTNFGNRPMTRSFTAGETKAEAEESLNLRINKLARKFPEVCAMRKRENQSLPNLSKFLVEKSIKYELV
jgi:hypothetical protein